MAGEQESAGADVQLLFQRGDGALRLRQLRLLRLEEVCHLRHCPHLLGEHEGIIDRH